MSTYASPSSHRLDRAYANRRGPYRTRARRHGLGPPGTWLAVLALSLVALFVAYLLAGYLGVPYVARTRLQSFVQTHYGRALTVRDIQFNPLTFRIEASGVALPDADGKPMLSFEHLRAQPSLATLWRKAPSFREIVLEQPQAHVVVRHDGSLNLADLVRGLNTQPQAGAGRPMQLFIDRLWVLSGTGSFEDRTLPGPFIQHLRPVNFELRDFSSQTREGIGNAYALTAISAQGARLKWNGSFSLRPLASRGTLELSGVPLRALWAYARHPFPIATPPGTVALHGRYDASLKGSALALKVVVPDMTVTGLKLRPGKAPKDYVDLPRIAVSNTRVDLQQHSVDIGKVVEDGGRVDLWLANGGHVNLFEMLPAQSASSSSSPVAASSESGKNARGRSAHRRAPVHSRAAADASAGTLDGWHVTAPDIEVRHLKLAAEDRHVTPAVQYAADPMDVKVKGYSSAPGTELDVSIDSALNGGKLALNGKLNADTHAATATLNLAGVELRGLQPYLSSQTGMTVLSGNLGTHLGVERSASGVLNVTGDADVKDLRTVDDQARQDFIRWQDMRINQLHYASEPQSLQVDTVTVHAPYARVIIFPTLTTNVSEILTPSRQLHGRPRQENVPGAQPDAGAGANEQGGPDAGNVPVASSAAFPRDAGPGTQQDKGAQPPTPAQASKDGASGKESGKDSGKDSNKDKTAAAQQAAPSPQGNPAAAASGAEQDKSAPPPAQNAANTQASTGQSATGQSVNGQGGDGQTANNSANNSADAKGASGKGAAPAAPKALVSFPATIKTIQVIDGSANYSDYWIQPNFSVGIQTLNGTVSGISSDPQSRAQVELQGKVDRYAPAHIGGEMNLLSAFTYSDIHLSFQGVDMTSVTPYSGHFAGYKIDKGKMTVDLDYKIENRQLNAKQHFVINQLQLGEKVDSKAAVKLPVKLAVALLKDKNGVIDIGLPMTGSLDDPHFRVGPLIWKAFLNLLGKIVTAPFTLLGHLFGGGEHMNVVEFAPGSATLTPDATKKLDSVIKALNARPALQLEIPAAYADRDRQGLAELKILKGQKPHGQKAGAQNRDDSVLADPSRRFRLLVSAYRSTANGADLPESVLDANEGGGTDSATLAPAIAELEAAVLPHFPVTDNEMEQLGAQRAHAIEDALVAGGIDPQRLFILKEHHSGAGVKGGAGSSSEGAKDETPESPTKNDKNGAPKDDSQKGSQNEGKDSPKAGSGDSAEASKASNEAKDSKNTKATLDKVAVELSLD